MISLRREYQRINERKLIEEERPVKHLEGRCEGVVARMVAWIGRSCPFGMLLIEE
jgi:hypothetical protein